MTLRRTLFGAAALAALLAVGCGGNVEGTGGSGGSTGGSGGTGATAGSGGTGATAGSGGSGATAGSGGSGGSVAAGDCQSEADCGGSPCVEVTPGGYKVCLKAPPEATECMPDGPLEDECCNSAECANGGKCYGFTSLPYCGGAQPADYNVCVGDMCASDAQCDGGIPSVCAPAGAWGTGARTCVAAFCKTNADCTAKPGGVCAAIEGMCCSLPLGLACVYPGGCQKDADCASDGSQHCEIEQDTLTGVCVDGPEQCPA